MKAAVREVVEAGLANRLEPESFVASCRKHACEPGALADRVALSVARDYVTGARTFEEAGAVADALYPCVLSAAPEADRALRIHAAFDAGQYPLTEDGAWNEQETKRLLAREGITA
jgi:hypothetical protein